MTLYNPPHPGEFIRSVYLEAFGISARQLAASLDVSPSTLSRILKGNSGISPEMALRLSKVLGRSAESWLALQHQYDLWQAASKLDIEKLQPLNFVAA